MLRPHPRPVKSESLWVITRWLQWASEAEITNLNHSSADVSCISVSPVAYSSFHLSGRIGTHSQMSPHHRPLLWKLKKLNGLSPRLPWRWRSCSWYSLWSVTRSVYVGHPIIQVFPIVTQSIQVFDFFTFRLNVCIWMFLETDWVHDLNQK